MADPTGESKSETLRLDFDRRLMLRFRGSVITSDGGLLAYRELDDVLALTMSGGERLAEARTGKNRRHLLVGLLRQSVFGRLAGYEDVNDAERLCHDPAMRWVVGGGAPMGRAASASQMGRFEAEWLARPENLATLADLPGDWIGAVHQRRPPKIIVLDMDSSESPTYGAQEGSAYNGHFDCTCYHPLFVFNQLGDLERCALRSGNVHSATGWRDVLEPVVARYRGIVKRRYFRGDAAFANPEVYEFLEAEGYGYAIRLPANPVLQGKIGYLLKRPVGRPPHEVRRYYASFNYQAGSWSKPRRVVAKVEWHPGELCPRVGFIVTNLARPVERIVAFYNHRGTCEQYIKEGKGAIKWTRLSCRSFAANAVRLQLHALAYNLGNFMRTLAMPKTAERWSLTSLREKLIKIGAKVVSHGRYVVPDGRSRRVAADVRGYPDADRPAAGTARASMRGGWVRYDKRRRERCVSMQPIQSVSAPRPGQTAGSTACLQPLRDFLLPKTPRRADPDSATAVNPGNVGSGVRVQRALTVSLLVLALGWAVAAAAGPAEDAQALLAQGERDAQAMLAKLARPANFVPLRDYLSQPDTTEHLVVKIIRRNPGGTAETQAIRAGVAVPSV